MSMNGSRRHLEEVFSISQLPRTTISTHLIFPSFPKEKIPPTFCDLILLRLPDSSSLSWAKSPPKKTPCLTGPLPKHTHQEKSFPAKTFRLNSLLFWRTSKR